MMIRDAEFWSEVRRSPAGDVLFKTMIPMLNARYLAIAPPSARMSSNAEVMKLAQGTEPPHSPFGTTAEKHVDPTAEAKSMKIVDGANVQNNRNGSTQAIVPSPGVVSVLQQVMMFAVPIYALRYNIPAMSMSWSTSCFVDKPSKQLVTFGAGNGVKVAQHLRSRGCVAGDTFFAIVTDKDEVWSSGRLKVYDAATNALAPLGKEEAMIGITGKTLMLVGHGQRLASVTRAFTMRPLSAVSNPTRNIIPTRHIRFLDLGYGEDCYMVGTDSVVYKTTASDRAIGTPRRIMTLSRIPVSRIASGTSFMCVIDQNGNLYTIGRNRKGQLGNGLKQDTMRKPCLHTELLSHFFVMAAAGDCHSLALTSSGIVYGAGSNENGQLGLGASVHESVRFVPIPLPCRCIGVTAGPMGSMFACEDGTVYTCGLNDCMQLGVQSADKNIFTPTAVTVLTAGVESYTMDFGAYKKPEVPDTPSQDAAVRRAPPFTKRISSIYTVPPEPTKETVKHEKKKEMEISRGMARGNSSQLGSATGEINPAQGSATKEGKDSAMRGQTGGTRPTQLGTTNAVVAGADGKPSAPAAAAAASGSKSATAGAAANTSKTTKQKADAAAPGKKPKAEDKKGCAKCCSIM